MSKNPKKTTKADGRTSKRDGRSTNAIRHGLLARDSMLPWEKFSEYQELLTALTEEHRPKGRTEALLVEELAALFWRKKRLLPAERQIYAAAMLEPSMQANILDQISSAKLLAQASSEESSTDPKKPESTKARYTEKVNKFTSAMLLSTEEDYDRTMRTSAADNLDAIRLENLARYEAHLDRKMQRLLTILIGMQRARAG